MKKITVVVVTIIYLVFYIINIRKSFSRCIHNYFYNHSFVYCKKKYLHNIEK